MTAACPACAAAPVALEIAQTSKSQRFSVPGIRCAACIGVIEGHLSRVVGVQDARVNATQKRVTVNTDLPLEEILQELRAIGYEAFPLDEALLSGEADPLGRDILLRMGVAGFAMMNVMLLSVAVWSGATDAARDLFHLISAAIALPAVLFSARPFFDHAWDAIRAGRLNMDVPISLAIVLAGGMSHYEALHGGAHAYFDAALSLTFFLLIGRYLEHRTKSAAQSAARELAALEVYRAERKIGTRFETVEVNALAVGDIVLVGAGMRVPVDGLLNAKEAFTDRSFLTGESEPVRHARGAALCAGEINLAAPFEMHVTAIGTDTRLRRIAALVETAENARNSYTSLADKAARIYAPVVHILAAVTFAGWVFATGDLRNALNIAIAVLIITCPCALGLAVPAVSTAAISRLYGMGFLVKSGTALERLAGVSAMMFDKTGTLSAPGFSFEADHLNAEQAAVARGLAQLSSHPLAQALARHLNHIAPADIADAQEQPGLGIAGRWKGERVALGSATWLAESGSGLVLAFRGQAVALPSREEVLPGAENLAAQFGKQGIATEIISGDAEPKTADLARRIHVETWRSGVTPETKAKLVAERALDGAVCMVGDGINDTAALANATVSIAPGTALDATRNAADIVMIGDKLGDVPTVVRVARKTVALSKQNFGIALAYNLVAVPLAMAGFATPLLAALAMSASSITVLVNAMRVRF
ncbi:MAG: heavy metal translocating P-type ATPase [Pseudomonadota bacterium]